MDAEFQEQIADTSAGAYDCIQRIAGAADLDRSMVNWLYIRDQARRAARAFQLLADSADARHCGYGGDRTT